MLQLSIDGTPKVAIVGAKLLPVDELVWPAELQIATRIGGVFGPNWQIWAVWISAEKRNAPYIQHTR